MYWNKPIEMMEIDRLKALQLERLQTTARMAYQNVSVYRERMQKDGVDPDDINSLDDIRRLPFTEKNDLRDHYPFGLFAAPQSEIVRIHASSGTTGKPIVAGYTQKDVRIWSEIVARSLGCAHVTRDDTVQVAYGYGLFTGGLGLHYGVERMGGKVVPVSSGNTRRQLTLMEDLGTTAIACTPSYALMIGETLRREGFDLSRLKLKTGIFGAEPWTEGMRRKIEELLNIKALDIYGLTEIIGPGVAMECLESQNGLHVWEDHFFVEILNPETQEPVPDGEYGELCISTISKEGMPLIRYRTHDLTAFIPEPCVCGRTHRRIKRFRGRTDDMLTIRGVNVFPTQVESAITGIKGVAPRYMLIVDRVSDTDVLEVQVELAPDFISDEVRVIEEFHAKILKTIEQVLGVSIKLKLMEPGSIERSEGKSRRVIDNRHLFE
ncbi:MAG: phenylacetate--CoA ligase [Clostridiales bacterium]|jgi:phenylacetate-CoA ligase|nr:phenylacetate--CoA ligase [Clostridiales bacterium]